MKKLYKFFLLIIFISISNTANSKPVPPGSGAGDVAANILFLVDSSASMNARIGGDGIMPVPNAVLDNNNDLFLSQTQRNGIIKYNSNGTRNGAFGRVTGGRRVPCNIYIEDGRFRGGWNARIRLQRTAQVKFLANHDGRNLIFAQSFDNRARNMIFGFDAATRQCIYAIRNSRNRFDQFIAIDIKEINGTPYLFTVGRIGRDGNFRSCNLDTNSCTDQRFNQMSTSGEIMRNAVRISVASDGSMIYMTNGSLHRFPLTLNGGQYSIGQRNLVCNPVNAPNLANQLITVSGVAVSPEDNSKVYVGSMINNAVQRLTVTNEGCTVVTSVGSGVQNTAQNEEDSGELDASSVRFSQVAGVEVSATRVIVSTNRGFVDVFDEDLFTVDDRDTAWLLQMGGPLVTRWTGLKDAMNTIVNDSTLTNGAHFGFGHWNAGQTGGPKNRGMGGRRCHSRHGCTYYLGWRGANHPFGTSRRCNRDSCLNIGISPQGASRIMTVMRPLGLAFGTDSNAWAQMAFKYFTDGNAGGKVYKPEVTCQKNYVIVIGDGMMRNSGVEGQRGNAHTLTATLRGMGIKTLFVAYGGNIRDRGMDIFDALAWRGSCAAEGNEDCEETIVADTPADLQTELASKIRQIVQTRLSSTAPSITATLEEGGHLYQAQFTYKQFREWEGHLYKKRIDINDQGQKEVDHLNPIWDAAEQILAQSEPADQVDRRNLWTAMPNVPYLGNWDNFNTDNSDNITNLFNLLGYRVGDYYNSSGSDDACSNTALGVDGNADDILGLINFMKGTDYFNYSNDCGTTDQVRSHVMGDVYHSQLVEVGPPDMNVDFRSTREEAYYRQQNNYIGFMSRHASREPIIYAGSNSGILHAINVETGREEWGFIPPFMAALLPKMVNPDLNGKIDDAGGSNPIFGVDGSPVVHDVFIRGYDQSGQREASKNWHTILFVPYGRGGSGFSVLDITHPIVLDGRGPIHMFSVYHDEVRNRVLIADVNGTITEHQYLSGSASSSESLEGETANDNQLDALERDVAAEPNPPDGEPHNDDAEQIAIASCQTNDTAGLDGSFSENGTSSCYTGSVFTFDAINLDFADGDVVPPSMLKATEIDENGIVKNLTIGDARIVDGNLQVTLSEEKSINFFVSETNPTPDDQFSISTSCGGAQGIEPRYDYSQLGETWSTPRIFRIPNADKNKRGDYKEDNYVAVMGGGMAPNSPCGGSAVFLIDLEDLQNPGSIYAAEINGGPISLVDTANDIFSLDDVTVDMTSSGSDIGNAVPTDPVVITPDTGNDIPWRGAMVYVNDHEGKITKINLTNSEENDAELFDQVTLFNLNANTTNARYTYFSMDAGIGLSTQNLWLFGGTGNFNDLGGREPELDNILYGIKDSNFPNFDPNLNGTGRIPRETKLQDGERIPDSAFTLKALEGFRAAASITTPTGDQSPICEITTGDTTGESCPTPGQKAWVIKLDKNSAGEDNTPKQYRKTSAPPTVFKGQVYFPVFQPPPESGTNDDLCDPGNAYVCAADDECGTNNSSRLEQRGVDTGAQITTNNDPTTTATDALDVTAQFNECRFVREGVLSELVVFGDELFGNVAGQEDQEATLYQIRAIAGEIISNKGGWRDSSF